MAFYSSPFFSPFFPRMSVASPISRIFDDDFFSPGFPSLVYDEQPVQSSSPARKQQQQRLQDSSSQAVTSSRAADSGNTAVQGGSGKGRSVHHHHHLPVSLFSPLMNAAALPEMTVDLLSSDTAYSIHAAVPGIDKKDIQLTVEDGNVLRIQAERREERKQLAPPSTATLKEDDAKQQQQQQQLQDSKEEKEQKTSSQQPQDMQVESSSGSKSGDSGELRYHHVESYYGRVERRLQLPEDADLDAMTARYDNGVLKINLPRLQDKKNSKRTIQVQ